MIYVAGEDAETQRNGLVMLFWPGCRELQMPSPSYRTLVGQFIRVSPTRIISFHFCFPVTPFFLMLQTVITVALKVGNRITRVKVHNGERTELQYQLMGYGIPVTLIPTTGTGTLKTKVFLQWVKARNILELSRRKSKKPTTNADSNANANATAPLFIDCPGVRDVIFRPLGKSCMLNPGNVAFRGIFEKYHSEHIQAGQTEKKNLVWKIVEEIESGGGRFLVWEKKGWWVPLYDRAEIRNKVATSLRGYNKQRRAEHNRQCFKSSTALFQGQDGKRLKVSRLDEESSTSDEVALVNSCQKFFLR